MDFSAFEGRKAPKFSLLDKDGKAHSLSEFQEEYVVVFFYPKDNTPGCTIETKGFDALGPEFSRAGIRVVGISGGNEKSKGKFCDKYGFQVLLLSDTDFEVSKAYGVYGEKKFMGRTFSGIHRVTFVIDSGRKVLKVFGKVKPGKHPHEVLDYILGLA